MCVPIRFFFQCSPETPKGWNPCGEFQVSMHQLSPQDVPAVVREPASLEYPNNVCHPPGGNPALLPAAVWHPGERETRGRLTWHHLLEIDPLGGLQGQPLVSVVSRAGMLTCQFLVTWLWTNCLNSRSLRLPHQTYLSVSCEYMKLLVCSRVLLLSICLSVGQSVFLVHEYTC